VNKTNNKKFKIVFDEHSENTHQARRKQKKYFKNALLDVEEKSNASVTNKLVLQK
jgi:hypothetical protein